MAIISPGPLAAAVSGSIGGTTFSHNKGGAYVRNRSIPTNPDTLPQQNIRAILSAQSQSWADRTDAERAAWEGWATQNPVTNALGNSINLSGHQAYIKLRSRLALALQTLIDVPPIINAPTALESMLQDGDIGLGNVDLTFAASPLGAGVMLWMSAAVVNSPGISYVKNLRKFIGTSAAAETTPFDNQTLIEAVFGTLVVGQTLHVLASTFDTATGLLSVPLSDSVVITTT